MLIDTHSHLNFNAFKKDSERVIKNCLSENVWMINVGSGYDTSLKATELSKKYPQGVYAAVGLHPIHLGTLIDDPDEEEDIKQEEFDFDKFLELAKSPGVKAIGEIGLDYYYKPKTNVKLEAFKKKQKEVVLEQIGLAKKLGLPIIFHCRMAQQDLIEILKKHQCFGVIHCFSGTWQEAKQYLDMGFYLGFNGIMYKMDLKEVIEKCPLERMLVETDCPYLTPPFLNEKRNQPLFVRYIAQEIAKIRKISLEEISEITTRNAKQLFKI
jgi:TatD DNase family protein